MKITCLSILAAASITVVGAFSNNGGFVSHPPQPTTRVEHGQKGSSALHVATLPDIEEIEMGKAPFFVSSVTAAAENPLQHFDEKATRIKMQVAKKKSSHQNDEGPLAPLVVLMREAIGQQSFNSIRGKAISLHSTVIRGFVNTADSPFGDAVLRALFLIADMDEDGLIHEKEMMIVLHSLGFTWLKDDQIKGIFERANVEIPNHITIDEFVKAAPKTLSTNLIKLAKKNGGKMGLLA